MINLSPRTTRLVGLLVGILTLTACGGASSQPAASRPSAASEAAAAQKPSQPTPVTLHIGYPTTSMQWAPIYVAEDAGFFKQEGITVESTVLSGGPNMVAGLLGGSLDIGVGAMTSVIEADSHGRDLEMIAPLINEFATNIVVSNKFAQSHHLSASMDVIQKIKGLKGAKIAAGPAGDARTLIMRRLLSDAGLSPDKDVELLPLGKAEDNLSALKTGAVDAFVFSPPTSNQAVVSGDGITLIDLCRGEYQPLKGFLFTGMMARRSWVDKNRDAATRFLLAITKAYDYTKQHPAETQQVVAKRMGGINSKALEDAFADLKDAYATTPVVDKRGFDLNISFLKVDNPSVKVTFEQAVDTTVAQKALELAHK